MNLNYVTLGENGRVVIPASVRESLNLKKGDRLSLKVEDGELRLVSAQARLAKAKAIMQPYLDPKRSYSQELIKERRLEAQRD